MEDIINRLKIIQYELEFDEIRQCSIVLEHIYGIGRVRWGIRNHGSALGKTPDNHGYYHFSIECLPSSRDDSYYCEYRWDTAEKAFKFWRENRSKIIATNLEIRNFFDKFHRT